MLVGYSTQEGLNLKRRQFQHETLHATDEKKTFDLLFHRNGLVETAYCTDQQEQWIDGSGERSLQTATPSDSQFLSRGDISLPHQSSRGSVILRRAKPQDAHACVTV